MDDVIWILRVILDWFNLCEVKSISKSHFVHSFYAALKYSIYSSDILYDLSMQKYTVISTISFYKMY